MISWFSVIRGWTSASIASVLMGILAYTGALHLDLGVFRGFVNTSVRLFPLVGVCVLIYVALLFLFRVPEVDIIKRILRHKTSTIS